MLMHVAGIVGNFARSSSIIHPIEVVAIVSTAPVTAMASGGKR